MRKVFALVLLLSLSVVATSVFAQEDNVIVDGLQNPRAIYFDDAGTLYVVDAGNGGDQEAPGDFGPVAYGYSSGVWTLEQGAEEPSELIGGLMSMGYFQSVIGAADVAVTDDTIWVLTAMGVNDDDDTTHPSALIGYDRATLEETTFVDLGAFEAENNPDNDEVVSNPNDMAIAPDGTVYIADSSGNSLLSWTEADGVQLVAAWEDLPVPTAVDVADDGSVYVSFLSAFPFDEGTARVEKWVDGELAETYSGLTAVTDVYVAADGTVYAVEMSSGVNDTGWVPNSGKVVAIAADGTLTDMVTDLNFPYDIAQDANGVLYVTLNAAYSEPGTGQVIQLAAG